MKRKTLLLFAVLFAIGLVNPSIAQTVNRPGKWAASVPSKYLTNLFRVSDDVYRSEQPNHDAFVELSGMGVKSVLNLRTTEKDDEIIGGINIKPYLVSMDAGDFTDKDVIDALNAIANAPKPILIHCRHGSDRTGVVVAMYRIIFQNWTKEEALDELMNGGYGFHTYYKNIPEYIKNVNVESIRSQIKK